MDSETDINLSVMFGYPLRLSQRPAPQWHEELQGPWEGLTGKEERREKDDDLEGESQGEEQIQKQS